MTDFTRAELELLLKHLRLSRYHPLATAEMDIKRYEAYKEEMDLRRNTLAKIEIMLDSPVLAAPKSSERANSLPDEEEPGEFRAPTLLRQRHQG